MSQYETKSTRIEGQDCPYVLQVHSGINCKLKVCMIDKTEVVSLVIIHENKQFPLQYNDSYYLYFSGSGGVLKELTQGQLCLIDECGTPQQTIYIFEKNDDCYWTRHIFSEKFTARDVPSSPPVLVLSQVGGDAIWNFYSDKAKPGILQVIETRSSGLYKHRTSVPIDNWASGKSFDIRTDTDYVFFLRSGKYWVQTPSCDLIQLQPETNEL